MDTNDVDRPLPPTQDGFVRPKGTLEVQAIRSLQSVTVDSVKDSARTELLGIAQPVRSNLFGRITEWGQANVVEPLRQIFAGKIPTGWEHVAQAFQDGQTALTRRLDLLSPLLDYGSVYMEQKGGFWEFGSNYGDMPFTKQVGPMRGCEVLPEGGIRLKAAGLWDIRLMMTFGENALQVGSGKINLRVKVLTPTGQLYSQAKCFDDVNKAVTETVATSVVVPEAGYLVKVEVSWVHGSRQLAGGPANNRLIVQRVNHGITGNTGAEASDEIKEG